MEETGIRWRVADGMSPFPPKETEGEPGAGPASAGRRRENESPPPGCGAAASRNWARARRDQRIVLVCHDELRTSNF